MSDLIDRKQLIEDYNKVADGTKMDDRSRYWAIETIKAQPAIQQEHPECDTCEYSKETGDIECKLKHYLAYCSNHTELRRGQFEVVEAPESEPSQEQPDYAEIGRATVAQYEKGFMLIKQKGNLTTAFLTVKDIVDWHHREEGNHGQD